MTTTSCLYCQRQPPAVSTINDNHQLSLLSTTTTSCLYYQWRPPAVSTINDDYQLSLLSTTTTSCLYYQRQPPAFSTINNNHQLSLLSTTTTSCLNYFHGLYNHKSLTYNKINCHLLLLSSRLCSLHCPLAGNLLTPNNKNSLWGWHSYWPCNKCINARTWRLYWKEQRKTN